MTLLALLTDAFGGRGGIAKFNRDLLRSLCAHQAVERVMALPRHVPERSGTLPANLDYVTEAAAGKSAFIREMRHRLGNEEDVGGIVCGHIYLLPLAAYAAARTGAPLLLIVHGVDAWTPTQGRIKTALTRFLMRRVDAVVSVSEYTKRRMTSWLPIEPDRIRVIPNCIDASLFGRGPKRDDLLGRYGLHGRTILMTLARLSAQEQYKGFDEVIEALPKLAEHNPDIAYLICGDGDDRPRLERKAADLAVSDRVVFSGYVAEDEKADHYRLADTFVMPGRGEGFGIVYLEALACGIPVVASCLDASQEAVRHGELGEVVDPRDLNDLVSGICDALATPKGIPDGLAYFSFESFRTRWHEAVEDIFVRQAVRPARPEFS